MYLSPQKASCANVLNAQQRLRDRPKSKAFRRSAPKHVKKTGQAEEGKQFSHHAVDKLSHTVARGLETKNGTAKLHRNLHCFRKAPNEGGGRNAHSVFCCGFTWGQDLSTGARSRRTMYQVIAQEWNPTEVKEETTTLSNPVIARPEAVGIWPRRGVLLRGDARHRSKFQMHCDGQGKRRGRRGEGQERRRKLTLILLTAGTREKKTKGKGGRKKRRCRSSERASSFPSGCVKGTRRGGKPAKKKQHLGKFF